MTSFQNKKKYRIEVLGCRTNQYEAQAFRDQLEGLGYEEAKEGDSADVCIVNTCTVTQSADSTSRNTIRQLARREPHAKLVVTGCLAERDPNSIKSIEGVDLVISNPDKEMLIARLFPEEEVPEFSIKRFEAHTRAFVKVQDGCNSFCTYCIIPYVRGRSKSRTVESVVKEVEELVRSGYKEIVLTGINVGDFDGGREGGPRLSDLIREVDGIDGLHRLRVSSIDPDEVDCDLQDAILKGKKTCHSMHLVLQAGSNMVLKRMNRKYTRQVFQETLRRLKAESPSFTATTDVIVGFPGETEADFQETLLVIKEAEFAKVHMFPYSDRPRTRSNLFPNKVPSEIINDRKARVIQAAEESSFALRERYIGQRMSILTEECSHENGLAFGHTDNFLGVFVQNENLKPNQIVEVQLVENRPDGLYGKAIS